MTQRFYLMFGPVPVRLPRRLLVRTLTLMNYLNPNHRVSVRVVEKKDSE